MYAILYCLEGPSWSWLYGSWIYNYLCNQCLSSLKLWVRIRLRQGVLDTTLCHKVCQWLATGRWFTPVSPSNNTDHHDIAEILSKVALNTINQPTNQPSHCLDFILSFVYLFKVVPLSMTEVLRILYSRKIKTHCRRIWIYIFLFLTIIIFYTNESPVIIGISCNYLQPNCSVTE